MTRGWIVRGLAMITVGGIWIVQGAGALKGSFMTGSPFWFWIGVGLVMIGSVDLWRAVRSARNR